MFYHIIIKYVNIYEYIIISFFPNTGIMEIIERRKQKNFLMRVNYWLAEFPDVWIKIFDVKSSFHYSRILE